MLDGVCSTNAITNAKVIVSNLILLYPATILGLYTPNLIIQNISIDSEGLAINVPTWVYLSKTLSLTEVQIFNNIIEKECFVLI